MSNLIVLLISKYEYNIIINKQNGVRGRSPRNFTKYFLNFKEFLLNHHRNIAIVLISQQIGWGNIYGGGAIAHMPVW